MAPPRMSDRLSGRPSVHIFVSRADLKNPWVGGGVLHIVHTHPLGVWMCLLEVMTFNLHVPSC